VDSQSDPEVSRADYQAAIDDPSVQLAFFNWHSNVALEFSQMASAASFPHLFASRSPSSSPTVSAGTATGTRRSVQPPTGSSTRSRSS